MANDNREVTDFNHEQQWQIIISLHEKDPQDPRILNGIVRIIYNKPPDKIIDEIKNFLEEQLNYFAENSIESLGKICWLLADIHSHFCDYDRVLKYLDQYNELLPGNQRLYYSRIADVYITLEDYEQAFIVLQKLRDLSPIQSRTYSRLGFIFFHKNNYKEAIRYYDLALKTIQEQEPNLINTAIEHEIKSNKALTYMSLKDYSTAINLYKKLVTESNSLEYRNYLAWAYIEAHQFDQALFCLQDIEKKLSHTSSSTLRIEYWQFHFIYSLFYQKQALHFPKKSLEHHSLLQKALQEMKLLSVRPDRAYQTHQNLGEVFYALGEFNTALEYFNKSLAHSSELFTKYRSMIFKGRVLSKSIENLNGALESFKTAIQLDPNRGEAYYQLAKIYFKLKNMEAAKIYFQKSLDIFQTTFTDNPHDLKAAERCGDIYRHFAKISANSYQLKPIDEASHYYKKASPASNIAKIREKLHKLEALAIKAPEDPMSSPSQSFEIS